MEEGNVIVIVEFVKHIKPEVNKDIKPEVVVVNNPKVGGALALVGMERKNKDETKPEEMNTLEMKSLKALRMIRMMKVKKVLVLLWVEKMVKNQNLKKRRILEMEMNALETKSLKALRKSLESLKAWRMINTKKVVMGRENETEGESKPEVEESAGKGSGDVNNKEPMTEDEPNIVIGEVDGDEMEEMRILMEEFEDWAQKKMMKQQMEGK